MKNSDRPLSVWFKNLIEVEESVSEWKQPRGYKEDANN
jgi:hypothetical protein